MALSFLRPHCPAHTQSPETRGECVTYVAENPSTGDGTEEVCFAHCAATVEAVDAAQVRTNAMPGLWGGDRASSAQRFRTGTHSTRAVLDALCLYMAQAAQLTVEAECAASPPTPARAAPPSTRRCAASPLPPTKPHQSRHGLSAREPPRAPTRSATASPRGFPQG